MMMLMMMKMMMLMRRRRRPADDGDDYDDSGGFLPLLPPTSQTRLASSTYNAALPSDDRNEPWSNGRNGTFSLPLTTHIHKVTHNTYT